MEQIWWLQITSAALRQSRRVRMAKLIDTPIEGICVEISTRERDQLPSFPKVIERFDVCSVNDVMKIAVHNKGVIEACRLESEECQDLQRSYHRTLGLENQSCLIT